MMDWIGCIIIAIGIYNAGLAIGRGIKNAACISSGQKPGSD